LLGGAILLRALVALVLLGDMPLVSDAREYFDLALRLASGDTHGAFYWPPGESVVLAGGFALLGKSVLAARIVTIATSTATVALTALLAKELAGERVARATAWLAMFYAPSVLLCGQTYAQHLAALSLAAVAYFAMRALREKRPLLFALAGIALGLGCLSRPSMGSIVPVLAFGWWVTRPRELIGPALAACAAIVVVVPAQAHDAREGAGFTISTNNERNLFLGNNPYTPDYKTSHLGQRSIEDLPPEVRAYLESFYARPDARAAMQREAIAYAIHHPVRTAWRTLNRATSFWGFDYLASREIQAWRGWSVRRSLPLLALEAGGYVAVAALALVAIFALGGTCDSGWRTWLLALALAYEAPYAIAFSGGTYHFPAMPLLLPFAALALVDVRATWRAMRASHASLVAVGVFGVVQVQYAYYAVSMSG
jgi:4-amino-4-deoxy-L-arabinose transferase-like glycosyltransferase